MAGLVSFSKASAAGNVLLPPETSDKSNLPNLGLIPAEPEPLPPETKPVETPKPPVPAALPKPATPVAKAPPPYVPPPNYTPPPQAYRPPPAYGITISLAKTSWSPADIQTVSSQLGIAKTSVPVECQMAINGMVISSGGVSSVTNNPAPSTTVGYDGAVTNAMLTAYAACNSAPQPAASNYIQRLGDKYGVPIGSATCEPKTPFAGTTRQVVMTHTATGADSCTYQ